ncbi:MAG: hypothetical protein PUP90_07650 [Nostoc sp. S4]|nr:hypothetical protein [Nostoc sp. S4]
MPTAGYAYAQFIKCVENLTFNVRFQELPESFDGVKLWAMGRLTQGNNTAVFICMKYKVTGFEAVLAVLAGGRK